jgi:hypothetical protein
VGWDAFVVGLIPWTVISVLNKVKGGGAALAARSSPHPSGAVVTNRQGMTATDTPARCAGVPATVTSAPLVA